MTDSLDPGDFVFIRYIRITHRTGIQRCFEDNKNRTFGLLPAFLRSLDDLFESRQEPCTCYEFVDGSLEDVDSTGAGDLKEKSLIALFGHPSLLNKQHGGFFQRLRSFEPRGITILVPGDKCIQAARQI